MMNLYLIVEGRRTEYKIYPEWLRHHLPQLIRVPKAIEAKTNNYYLFNGNGFPSLLHNHLQNSIDEINDLKSFNYLILILDVDELTVNGRIREVNKFMKDKKLELFDCELVIIPQNRCIETWLLGNRTIYKANPQNSDLSNYIRFYNVKELDPELMGKYPLFETHSQFHAEYATQFLRERNIRYSKNIPNTVTEEHYYNELIKRAEDTGHLKSFYSYISFCNLIKRVMNEI